MKIDSLISELERLKIKHGNVEVTMQATLLPYGYSATNSTHSPDVFESTVSTLRVEDGDDKFDKRIRLYWQV